MTSLQVTPFLFKNGLLPLVLTIALLAGCAVIQPTPFIAAESYGEMGYSSKKLTNEKYQIMFAGNSKTEANLAKDYALLHAAKLTTELGFDWFEIVESDTDIETKTVARVSPSPIDTTVTASSCGVLGCTITRASAYEGGQVFSEQVADKVISTLTISMGSGNPKNPNRVFDAKQLSANLNSSN